MVQGYLEGVVALSAELDEAEALSAALPASFLSAAHAELENETCMQALPRVAFRA